MYKQNISRSKDDDIPFKSIVWSYVNIKLKLFYYFYSWQIQFDFLDILKLPGLTNVWLLNF